MAKDDTQVIITTWILAFAFFLGGGFCLAWYEDSIDLGDPIDAMHHLSAPNDVREYQASLVGADTARGKKANDWCLLQSVCYDYAKVRQDCATSGDYQNCLSVKLGPHTALAAQGVCDARLGTIGDTLHYPNKGDTPGSLECWKRTHVPFLNAESLAKLPQIGLRLTPFESASPYTQK